MLKYCVILLAIGIQLAICYSNKKFTITKQDMLPGGQCSMYNKTSVTNPYENINNTSIGNATITTTIGTPSFPTIKSLQPMLKDPLVSFEGVIQQIMYGRNLSDPELKKDKENETESYKIQNTSTPLMNSSVDVFAHMPSGAKMRAELFQNKNSVHLTFPEYLHRSHAYLNITRDHMQTALDAFMILLAGNVLDVLRLPSAYVLKSARTIAMMRIAREKLSATWQVVKGTTPTHKISYDTLEMFRPLFKYLSAKEMARLNLKDKKILTYIGTHPDLTRHQVGVVANRYMVLNPNWTQIPYLNVMNNLLCGVPMMFMRGIPRATYLQLTHQIFYHIRACDPFQRRFYFKMMTGTQALGSSFSWSTRDVSRLGLLLAEVNGPSFSAIVPESMAGITSQVMLQMPTEVLLYVTDMQMSHLDPKSRNILVKKINAYRIEQIDNSSAHELLYYRYFVVWLYILWRLFM